MWIDNASKIDMLAYYPYSELLMDIIRDERMQPLTVGLFGSWGIGKSTLLQILENNIKGDSEDKGLFCVNLNAWIFESYDDAKTSIMESLLKELQENKNFVKKAGTEITNLLKRIDYMKLAASAVKTGIPLAISLATANPAPIMLSLSKTAWDSIIKKPKESLNKILDEASSFKSNYVKDAESNSIVDNVRLFRNEFAKMIKKIEVKNLVVLIDDLDRCNPDRIIEILEAIKLFLSVEKTTFIIAVDERVVKYAIKEKYPLQSDDSTDISKDYIEKIIQLPIRLPELSSIDVENYLMLLVYEMYLGDKFQSIVNKLYEDGVLFNQQRITSEKIEDYCKDTNYKSDELIQLRNTIVNIKNVVADSLKGNPRQAKRFLNMFLVRKKLACIYFKGENAIKDEVLAKLMSLEYINKDKFQELYNWYQESTVGIEKLEKLYGIVSADKIPENEFSSWNDEQLKRWVMSEPKDIYNMDLSKYFYISRDVLKEKTYSLDMLTAEDKETIEHLIKNREDAAMQKGIISKVILLERERKNNLVKAIYELFKKNTLGLVTLAILFDLDSPSRYDIAKTVIRVSTKTINAAEVGFLQSMYRKDADSMKPCIEELKSKGKINATKYNKIIEKAMK
ncbi:P-loop NTPase fold protein [Clostridium estertheticum]|uniref:KAP family P-loop NTPase fold protein n=1 Tax=Clostridium estertheticum TaxID=238834 RepID=UPI001CF26DE7|nr:P-loop NTPase fold protein [Clostridium estertheticum]MCB2361981.1 KAP family NTPase [Clostridium estertheticum]